MRRNKTLTAKAAVVASDLGEFQAIVSTPAVDADNETVVKGAFTATIRRWRQSGKLIPLHWNHGAEPEDIVGEVDPATMEETDEGLVVSGKIDLETERGRDVWRSVKSNRVSFSFGFMITESEVRDDGVRELRSVDLYEISVTPTPANSDTRVLGWKANGGGAVADDEGQSLLRLFRDLERRQRAGEFDEPVTAPAHKSRSTAPVKVARFEVE